ncbi:MAG: uroporphyrinogen-III synthase [Oceanicaulis sp.]
MTPVLVTRAEPGATRTIERLRARGINAINAATARVQFRSAAPRLDGVGAIAFTSPNGVGAFAANSERRDLPVMAVGAVTAAAARAAGFNTVISADGDGAALARLIANAPPDGTVLHVTGADQGFDLVEALGARGIAARAQVMYEAVESGPLREEAAEALRAGAIILVHSPLGARRFFNQAGDAGLTRDLGACQVAAISAKAAAPLAAVAVRRVFSAETPDEDALFKLLDQLLARRPG